MDLKTEEILPWPVLLRREGRRRHIWSPEQEENFNSSIFNTAVEVRFW